MAVEDQRDSDNEPPLLGLAIAVALWWTAILFFYAPTYLHVHGNWAVALRAAGAIALVISLGGAGFELAKIWKTQALESWGVALVFLTPAALLHLLRLSSPWELIIRSLVLLLLAFGGTFVFWGFAYLIWDLGKRPRARTESEQAAEPLDSKTIWTTILPLLSASYPLLPQSFNIERLWRVVS